MNTIPAFRVGAFVLLALVSSVPAAFAANPTSTIGVDLTAVTTGQSVAITVYGADTDGNLQFINIDQVSPNAGYYGPGSTGTQTPPNNGANYIGGNYSTFSRVITLTLSATGTYVFIGMTHDGASGWISSTNSVTVVVTAPSAPTIVTHPASTTKLLGFDVVFGVSATGTGPFTYQWKKTGTNISGATNSTLILYNISGTSAAGYTVVVTNSAGSTTSNSATLTVTDPDADADSDGLPTLTETALGTSAGTTTNDSSNTQQQNIHRPTT